MRSAIVIDRLPFDILHHQERASIIGGAAIDEPGDIGVLEMGQYLPLGAEAAKSIVGIHSALDDFDGHLFAKRVVALREVNRADAAPADFLYYVIRP